MNKLFRFIVILNLLILSGCYSAQITRDMEKNLDEVMSFPGIKKEQLYNQSLMYIARSFNSSNDVVQFKDAAAGRIIGKAVGKYSTHWGNVFFFNYTFIISAKDEKIRTQFEYINGHVIGNSGYPDLVKDWEMVVESIDETRVGLYRFIKESRDDNSW